MNLKHLIESSLDRRVPKVGDIISVPEVALFCGTYKGKWIVATENTSPLDKEAWDIDIMEGRDAALIIKPGYDRKKADALYNRITKVPFMGSIVDARGFRGHYLRAEGYGLEHRVAVQFTQENQDQLSRVDLDRIVEVDGKLFGLMHVISENLNLISFPEQGDVRIAAQIASAPAKIRTRHR